MNLDFVAIGHVLKETVIAEDGSVQVVLGGPAAYTTVCAARLGSKAGIVSHVGSDLPDEMLAVLHEVGVDQSGLHRDSPCTTTNELGYDAQGRKRVLLIPPDRTTDHIVGCAGVLLPQPCLLCRRYEF